MNEQARLQVEQAISAGLSGTLRDWPLLDEALRGVGIELPPDTPGVEVRRYLCAVAEIVDGDRQPCEIWTRVMGYHRPVAVFNRGKQSEHRDRLYFSESPAGYCQPAGGRLGSQQVRSGG